MQVTLIKMSDNPNALRTKEVEGYTVNPPEAGSRFRMFADGYSDPSMLRLVETSVVKESTKKGDDFEFRTESGTVYYLKVTK